MTAPAILAAGRIDVARRELKPSGAHGVREVRAVADCQFRVTLAEVPAAGAMVLAQAEHHGNSNAGVILAKDDLATAGAFELAGSYVRGGVLAFVVVGSPAIKDNP